MPKSVIGRKNEIDFRKFDNESDTKLPPGGPHAILRGEGAVAFIISCLAYYHVDGDMFLFLVMFFVPDASIGGYWINSDIGSKLYNFSHSYIAPAIIGIFGLSIGQMALMHIALIWSAHIGMDRLLGFGLKYKSGFRYTHLGNLGRTTLRKSKRSS